MTNSPLYKECELRRFGNGGISGPTERAVRWLEADEAVVGRRVDLGDGEHWEILSAPEPALPGCVVRRFDPDGIASVVA